jgi:prepilin-type N-terminal cleavage/methylation domain-containing protein
MTFDKNRGFSLLEVLITMAVISVALVSLAKFQGNLLQGSSMAKNRTTAINLAQEQIEILRNTDFALLASGQDTISPDVIPGITETYTRVWTVVSDNVSNADVTVDITWSDYTTGVVTDDTRIQLVSTISNSSPTDSARLISPPPPPGVPIGPS